ncbi:MAG: SUMF1/EgtB/PvdO family nonheme iron enzyme [Kiritimatiellia bacterium]
MKTLKCTFALLSLFSAAPLFAVADARYVTVDIPKDSAILSLAEVEVFSHGKNIAPQGKAVQSETVNGGEAALAIDGNSLGQSNAGTITRTPDGGINPIWELDLGANVPIEKIVLWNCTETPRRLDGLRVTLSDADRKIVWEVHRSQAEDEATIFVPDAGQSPRAGQTLASIDEIKERIRIAMKMRATTMRTINTNALRDALLAYSEKYPENYPNAKALRREIDLLEKDILDGKTDKVMFTHYRELQKKVLLQHPAVDFKELIFVNRARGFKQGFPTNWQCHTGWLGNNDYSLRGYKDSILRGPLCQEDGAAKILRSSTAYLGELCLDWDAEKILISSGEEKSGPWGLYEMNVDGSDWRKAYENADPEVDYYDACYLPDGRIITTATVGFQGVPCIEGRDWVANLVLIDKERKSSRRLTFEQDADWNPQVYPNGRVVYLRWEYTNSAHYFSRILMTMNPDGSDQQEFYGSNSYWPNSLYFHQNIPGSSTKFVGIVSGHHGVCRKGELVMFDVTKGRVETQGAIHKFPFRNQPIENITKDYLVDGIKPFWLHPLPLNDELFIASMQDDGNAPWKIVLVDIYDNVLTLWEDPNANYYEAIPLKAQPLPATRPDRIDPTKKTTNVYMANVYRGQKTLENVPKGAVKKLRIFSYEYCPRNSGGHYQVGMEGPWDVHVLHGTVDVEADGSCMFEFPANMPFSVQPLDENGNALQLMRSWLVGMSGETISCIGCHENQNAAAPAGQSTTAARKPPQKVKTWFGDSRGFSFDREIQPVLDRKCVGCHNGKTDAKNAIGQPIPDFTYQPKQWGGFSGSYLALHPYVRRNGPEGDYHVLTPLEFHLSTSDLWQYLKKGHHGVHLDSEEWSRIATWVDLNVPYFGTWSERGSDPHMIAQRRIYERKTANVDFDPERIVNPYQPGAIAFVPPAGKSAAAGVAPVVEGWPFVAATHVDASATIKLDLGGRQQITAVKILPGKFVMGSNTETLAEAPAHIAEVIRPFYMGTTEVTMGMMQQFDPIFENGVYDQHYKDQVRRGYFVNNRDFPAIRVSHDQAQAFCAWLSKKTGKKVRLPSETEWEYACRAGTDTPMNYGGLNDDFSKHENLADVSIKKLAVSGVDPQPIRNPDQWMDYEKKDTRFNDGVLHLAKVGTYAPNGFGLYDLHGNVAEWTSSRFTAYPGAEKSEAFNAEEYVVRGGSWYQRPMRATSSIRWGYPTWMRPYNVGFRVVIED